MLFQDSSRFVFIVSDTYILFICLQVLNKYASNCVGVTQWDCDTKWSWITLSLSLIWPSVLYSIRLHPKQLAGSHAKLSQSSCVAPTCTWAPLTLPRTTADCTIWTTTPCPMDLQRTSTLRDHSSMMENPSESTSRTSVRVSTFSPINIEH